MNPLTPITTLSFGDLYARLYTAPWGVRRLFYWLIRFLLVCWVGVVTNWAVLALRLLETALGVGRYYLSILPGPYPLVLHGWVDFGLLLAARGGVGLALASLVYALLRIVDGEYAMALTNACEGDRDPGTRREWRRDLLLFCVVVVLARSWWDLAMYAIAYGVKG